MNWIKNVAAGDGDIVSHFSRLCRFNDPMITINLDLGSEPGADHRPPPHAHIHLHKI